MPVRQYANAPATALATSCTALATSIEVEATTGLPITYPFTLIIDRGTATEEAVSVTAAASTTLTVERGIDSTTAFAHIQGATVAHGITAQDIREANTHVNADSGVHGVTGDVVGTTDTQHLTNKTTTTEDTSDESEALATTEFVKAAIAAAMLEMHPVGDIVSNTSGTNPGTYLGGTWTAWGSGRVPVGVNAADAEFNTVEETGGAKTHTLSVSEMPSHNHGGSVGSGGPGGHAGYATGTLDGFAGWSLNPSPSGYINRVLVAADGFPTSAHSHTVSSQGGGAAHNNLQPYITCYMFKRTA